MRKRWMLAILISAAVAVAVPLAVMAFGASVSSPLDHQTFKYRQKPISTSGPAWSYIPGLRGVLVCARGATSASFNANLTGGTVRFRMRIDNGPLMRPHITQFSPSGGTNSFSFTFVGTAGTFEGSDMHAFGVQWRSVSGKPVTLHGANLDLLYHAGPSC